MERKEEGCGIGRVGESKSRGRRGEDKRRQKTEEVVDMRPNAVGTVER